MYASRFSSSSLDKAAWLATMSLICEISVPKRDAAARNRKIQYTCHTKKVFRAKYVVKESKIHIEYRCNFWAYCMLCN